MQSTDKAARLAGALYLLLIVSGPFSLIYIPEAIVVSGNGAATAANILSHETIFRLGIFNDLLSGTILLFLVFALYRLFKPVDQGLAAMVVILGALIPTPIYFLNSLNWIAALKPTVARISRRFRRCSWKRLRCSFCTCTTRVW